MSIEKPEDKALSKKEQQQKEKQEREQSKQQVHKKEQQKKWMTAGLIVIALIGFLWMVSQNNNASVTTVDNASADPSVGPEDASVVVVEYSDFECPACAAAQEVVKDIIAEYGDQIRFEYNDFPLPQHKHASIAAIGAQCAFDQGTFFEYHNLLFENQADWNTQGASEEEALDIFTGYAQSLNLNMNTFNTCTTSQEIADRVQEDVNEGGTLRVNSTPTFYVNGKHIDSAPYSVSIREAIDAALGAVTK